MELVKIFLQVLNMAVTAVPVMAAVFLLRGCMGCLPKRYAYYLWLIVGIRLICPVLLSSPLSIYNLFGEYSRGIVSMEGLLGGGGRETADENERIRQQEAAGNALGGKDSSDDSYFTQAALQDNRKENGQKQAAQDQKGRKAPGLDAGYGNSGNESMGNDSTGSDSMENDRQGMPDVFLFLGADDEYDRTVLQKMAAVVWAVGMAAVLLWNLCLVIRMRKRLEKAVLYRGVVYECDQIRSPFVMGLLHPRIYIPFRLKEEERECILRHEQYHIRRRDYLIKPAAFLLAAVYWFDPLVWLCFFSMGQDMEMSCDEHVLESSEEDIRKRYSSLLLSFALNQRNLSMGILAFGETGTRRRVKNIMRFQKNKKGIRILAGILVCAAGVVCLTNGNVHGERNNTLPKDGWQEESVLEGQQKKSRYREAVVVGETTVNGCKLKLFLAAEEEKTKEGQAEKGKTERGKTKEEKMEKDVQPDEFGIYQGTFVLAAYTEEGALLDEYELSFPGKSAAAYPENVEFVLSDYDGDGKQDDFSLGQGQMSPPELGNYMTYRFFTVEESGKIVPFAVSAESSEDGQSMITLPGAYSQLFERKKGQVVYQGIGENGAEKMYTSIVRLASVDEEDILETEPEKGILQAVKDVMPELVSKELEEKGVWHLTNGNYLLANGTSYEDITLRLDFSYDEGRLVQYVRKNYGFVSSKLPENKISAEQAADLVSRFAEAFCGRSLLFSRPHADTAAQTGTENGVLWQTKTPAKWGKGYAGFEDSFGAYYLVDLSHGMVTEYEAGNGKKVSDGMYQDIAVKSIARSAYGIDSYVEPESGESEFPLAFSENCRFFVNTSPAVLYREISFQRFASYIEALPHEEEKPCTVEWEDGLIVKIYLNHPSAFRKG